MAEAMPEGEGEPFPGLDRPALGTKVVVVGHSQVDRLGLEGHPSRGHHPRVDGPFWYKQISKPGARMDNLLDRDTIQTIRDFDPDIAFLFIGSNDLDVPEQVDFFNLIRQLKRIARRIHDINRIQVFVITAEHRRNPSYITPEIYNQRKNRFNQMMKRHVHKEFPVVFCSLQLRDSSYDGIHFKLDAYYELSERIREKAEAYAFSQNW